MGKAHEVILKMELKIFYPVALGAGIGAFRSLQAWYGSDEKFEGKRLVKTAFNGAWQGALFGLFIKDPLTLFGATYFGNVTLFEVWKARARLN